MKKIEMKEKKPESLKNNEKTYLIIIAVFLTATIGVLSWWGVSQKKHSQMRDTKVSSSADDSEGPLFKWKVMETKTEIDNEVIESRLTKMGTLITAKYTFKDVATSSKVSSLFGKELGFTEARFVVSYEGYVTAGVDFKGISVTIDDSEKKIKVTVPKAEIKDVVIDHDSFAKLDDRENVFNKFKIDDLNEAQKDLEKTARESALKSGLLNDADSNAKTLIENLVNEIAAGTGYKATIN